MTVLLAPGFWLRRFAPVAGVALCALPIAAGGRADTVLRILETDPPETAATLGRWQNFSLRIAYDSSEPVVIAAEPYADGRPAPAINGGQAHRGPGQGEILLWFTYDDQRRVDEVRVTGKSPSGRVVAQATLPVALAWTGAPGQPRQPAAWVQRLQAERDRAAKADYQAMMNSPTMQVMGAVVIAMVCTIPAYFLLQGWLMGRLRGGWRKAASVPLWPMGAVLAYTAYAFADGSNLFPLVLIFTAPLAFAYLAVIAAVRWLSHIAAPGT